MHHLAKSVVCPFFINGINYGVHCEGYKEGNSLRILFDNKESMDKHTGVYCNNINGYQKCPLYPVIDKQYKED